MTVTRVETQVIEVSSGEIEYTLPTVIRESEGKDISGDPIEVSIGDRHHPGTWQSPDRDPSQTDHSVRKVQILVNDAVQPGHYFLWVKIVDNPETLILRGIEFVVV